MKGLSKFQAFVRGCMIGLAMNMSCLLPVAMGRQASPSGGGASGGGGYAEFTPIDQPPLTRVADDPISVVTAEQRRFHARLFGEGRFDPATAA